MANNNFNIFVGVELDTSTIRKQLEQATKGTNIKINSNAKGVKQELDELDQSNKNVGDSAKEAGASYQVLNDIFQKSVGVISSMVGQVFELDDALTEFRKVSDLSGQELDDYVQKLNTIGNSVARTGSEMLEAAGEFRKNNFNDADSAQLAEIAALLQNTADEALSAGDAASFLISQMVAFDFGADQASHIADAVKF